jgi:hypothetical protein
MDYFKVAKFRLAKNPKKPDAPGKLMPLVHALRIVGNLGTHRDVLDRTELLDAFEVYEHALEELVGKKSAQIAKLAKKLKKHTGRQKKETFPF